MKIKLFIAYICLCAFLRVPLFAQAHTFVPLENQVYNVLEQAEARGLCNPLSGIRPYTRSVVITAIKEILYSEKVEKLKKTELEILEQYLAIFSKPKNGMDWRRGAWYGETKMGKSDIELSANVGAGVDIEGSGGFYSDDNYYGLETWIQVYANGDLGSHVSYNFIFEGGLMRAPRKWLGTYDTFYRDFPYNQNDDGEGPNPEYANRIIDIYSEPLTHFPYTYRKRWDGSIYFFDSPSYFNEWPDDFAGGYSLPVELTASFFENKLIIRMGRIRHDWSSTSIGSSLALNLMARPFLGIEGEFFPVSWLGFASMTGILEYYNAEDIYISPLTNQNAFSVTMLQFRYKNYFFLDFIDAVIWPKRFELGYLFPIINNFFYQNNIGKFDNMAITLSMKLQYPGIGNLWFSFFIDEMNLTADLVTLDRQMFAMQGGLNLSLPFLPFTSLKISYTVTNPYVYTHHRNYEPWYGDLRMEKSYSNNGVCLGYYLPPNSDEILVRFQTMPAKNVTAHLQYQMIRHGADFGPNAVDGSNLLSELDPGDRDNNPVLKRFFLQDGAYQWSHIIKIGAEWNLKKSPISFFGEAGTVISYFTDITEGSANDGAAHPYSIVDTSDYPQSIGYIVTIGIKIYPR